MRNACKILVGINERKIPVGRIKTWIEEWY